MESHFYQNHQGPSFQNLIGGNNHDWNQDLILTNVNEVLLSDLTVTHNPMPLLPLITPMVQDLGFRRINKIDDDDYMKHSMVGEELADSFPKVGKFDQIPSHKGYQFPYTLADGGIQTSDGELLFKGMSSSSRFTTLPTMSIPTSIRPPSSCMSPVSLGMDLQALDLLASAKECWNLGQPNSLYAMPLLGEENLPYFGFGHFEGPTQEPSKYHHKKSSLAAGKTLRSELHPSFSPLKARKEKLGDRIAALQQLVAPFGKTDTASVLTEAIGYIKFLQDQVETLSVPHMKTSKRLRTAEGASCDESTGCKPDLRSRGLCLVPLSCTSYVTGENGDFFGALLNFN